MTGKELLFALGELDEPLITEAAEAKPIGARWKKWTAIAACAALIVAAAVPYALLSFGRKGNIAPQISVREEWTQSASVEEEPTEAAQNGTFIPYSTDGEMPEAVTKTMIENYRFDPEICVDYVPPKNGDVAYSVYLLGAIDEYADEPIYRVLIDLFSDEQFVELTDDVLDEVTAELSKHGYTVAIEKSYLWDEPTGVYLTIHATAEQVRNFPTLEKYGVMLWLFGERAPIN